MVMKYKMDKEECLASGKIWVDPFKKDDGTFVKGYCKDKPNNDSNPYGTDKKDAEEEVRRLREKGEKARLIETNRKKKLYAPYEGVLPQKKDNATTPAKLDAPAKQERKKMNYTEAVNNMKPVHVDFRLEGDTRKGKIYAAIISGTDPKYGLKREFLNGDRTYSGKHNVTIDYDTKLKPGTIIEMAEGGSWKNSYGEYYIVTRKGLRQLKDNYNREGTLYVKDLIKAREKAIKRQNAHDED